MKRSISAYKPYGHKVAWKLSLIISSIMVIIMIIGYLYARSRDLGTGVNFMEISGITTIVNFLANTALMYVLFRYQFWAMRQPNKRKQFLFTIVGSFLLVLALSPLYVRLQIWMLPQVTVPTDVLYTMNFVKDVILLVIVLLFTMLLFMWERQRKTLLENQMLHTENLQNRYDVLKNQVDPHFLFNSLNTLNGLMSYDIEKAHEYVEQLSSVFRYTMQNKEILPLSEELDFAMSYIYLMRIRYNESLRITSHIDEKYLEYYILPCGLQLLIENAVKHNIISTKYPLDIIMETSGHETIIVRNSIRLKPEVHTKGGVGLANLNERYLLLFQKEIIITEVDGFFNVEVPLIKTIES